MCVLKMKFLPSAVQTLSSEHTHRQTDGKTDRHTGRHTDRHTDRQTRLKLLTTAYADGNNNNNLFSFDSVHNIVRRNC